MNSTKALPKLFLDKYAEFAVELLKTCPELKSDIDLAMFISDSDKVAQFRERILPSCSPSRDLKVSPGTVLPGVFLTDELWESFSQKTKDAIQQYLTLLSFSLIIDAGSKDDAKESGWTEGWTTVGLAHQHRVAALARDLDRFVDRGLDQLVELSAGPGGRNRRH